MIYFISSIARLPDPTSSLPFQLRGYTKTFSLYYGLLSSCPRLECVDLVFDSINHMNKLLKALAPSESTLRSVKFANTGLIADYKITTELVHRALKHRTLRNVEQLTLTSVRNGGAQASNDDPRTKLKLVSCTLEVYGTIFRVIKPFLPQDSSSLRKVSLTFYKLVPQDATWLFTYLPTTLEELEISLQMSAVSELTVEGYLNKAHGATDPFPHELLSRFSSLHTLALMGFTLPVQLLITLTSASSKIRRLNFYDSKWVPFESSRPTRFLSRITGILDPSLAINLLSPFSRLIDVHLGTLPTFRIDRYATLRVEMKARGIEFDCDPCIDDEVCEICGERH